MSAVFSGLFYRPSKQSFCYFFNSIIKKKKANNQFSKCSKPSSVQNVQVLDTSEKQWSFKTKESHTYIGNFSSHLNLCIKHYAS